MVLVELDVDRSAAILTWKKNQEGGKEAAHGPGSVQLRPPSVGYLMVCGPNTSVPKPLVFRCL